MDLQTMLYNAMAAKRAEEMKNSPQLTLGELILKLEAVKDKTLPVVFDDGEYKPTSIGSWRGSYCELAFSYTKDGVYDGYQGTDVERVFGDGYIYYYKSVPTELPENVTAQELLDKCKEVHGKTFIGYKGGDFVMGKTTPVWVANYGTPSGFKAEEGKDNQIVIDVTEEETVTIKTIASDY